MKPGGTADKLICASVFLGYPVGALVSFGVMLKWGWDLGAFYCAAVWPATWLVYLSWWLA